MFSRSTAQVWTTETSEDRRAGDRSSIRAAPLVSKILTIYARVRTVGSSRGAKNVLP